MEVCRPRSSGTIYPYRRSVRRLVEETGSGGTSGRWSKGKRQHAPDFTETGNMALVMGKEEPREKMGMKNDRDDAGDKRRIRRSRL